MFFIINIQKSLLAFFLLLAPMLNYCQIISNGKNGLISKVFSSDSLVKKNHFGIEITASLLPKAKIIKEEGGYQLKSHLQSSFDIGINYLRYLNESIFISTGFHIVIGKRNFFAEIPASDIPGSTNMDEDLLIEDKDIWGSIRIPFILEKNINLKGKPIYLKTGVNLRYSGFMTDLVMSGGGIIDSNNQVISIFSAFFSGNNNYKPWITFLAGVSKPIVLDNKNILLLSINADISPTYFFKGVYEITIPNKPVTSGTYKISGTSLGLSVQYIFTGYNKRLVRSYQKMAF